MHRLEPFSDPCRHAMLETRRGPAKRRASELRRGGPKIRELTLDGAMDHREEIGSQTRIRLEAKEHVSGLPLHASDPDLAVTEAGDGWHAGIDRPPPLAAEGHLELDTGLLAKIHLLHRQSVAFEQAANHFGSGHRLRLGTAPVDGSLGERFDPDFYPGKFVVLTQ